jgi:hypothetical protein
MTRGSWGIVCTDPDGLVVQALCGTGSAFGNMGQIFQIGRSIREADIGTNGLGCALIERQPIVIRAAEHFLDEVRPFACASVPCSTRPASWPASSTPPVTATAPITVLSPWRSPPAPSKGACSKPSTAPCC